MRVQVAKLLRLVARQLDGFGAPRLAAAMASGYAERMDVRRFVGRFRCLAPINSRRMHQTFLLVGGSAPEEVRQGCAALLQTLPLRQGDCVVFRGEKLWHRVEPVTAGWSSASYICSRSDWSKRSRGSTPIGSGRREHLLC